MQSARFTLGLIAILGFAYLAQSHPLSSRETVKSTESTEVALPQSHENIETKEVALPEETSQTTAIDTLGESNGRVKRQGGCGCCGCGCGCCCCRPRCCCCCRRCCTCCRTCCCTRCCTCCRPCCCGCGCGCGCGCCGCGGGGRKRRSLQTLKIKLAEKNQRETRQIEQVPETVAPVEIVEVPAPEIVEDKKPEEVETATEWPEPVYELVTETWAH
uniref:4Fe-4S ferredoxin-type domain-containing protein n=1 Tax=Caenorhabditis tropicalis TaxID=1561998 RepID=A0A1I7UBZ1_9PELO